jgi:Ser/Thr protein kinase RdoA (MazF antagonist)
MLDQVLTVFGFSNNYQIIPFGNGLINHTWRITSNKGDFILQRVNDQVFPDPAIIAGNIEKIGSWLQERFPKTVFAHPLRTPAGETMVRMPDHGYYRMFPFIKNSATTDIVETTAQAYEAAKTFGEFTHMLSQFPAHRLQASIPDFHNLSLRYHAFREAVQKGNRQRISDAQPLIAYLESTSGIVVEYERITANPDFHHRVTHHDTKISNVLFDHQWKGICVIDLDTVMPGYFISDLGDMLRTYLSPVSEEETDLAKINVRPAYFEAVVTGYLEKMQTELTPAEKNALFYAGECMIYMQSLRFLTDYLSDDPYYGSRYEGHNYDRALNQATLLQRYREQSTLLTPHIKTDDA